VFVYYLGGLQANLPSVAGLLPRRRGFVSRPVHVRYVLNRVALGQALPVLRYHSTNAPHSSSAVCVSYQQYNWTKPGILQCSLGVVGQWTEKYFDTGFQSNRCQEISTCKKYSDCTGGGPPPGFVACRLSHCAFWTVTLAWIRSRYDRRAWTEFRVGTGGRPLWTRWRTFGFHKMRQISWQAEELLASLLDGVIDSHWESDYNRHGMLRSTGVQLSTSRLPSVDLSSPEDFRLLAIGTATLLTVVSEKLRWRTALRVCRLVQSAVYCGLSTSELFNRLKAQWLPYEPLRLTFSNSAFCPHSIFICFVWIWEQTAFISVYNINLLAFMRSLRSKKRIVRGSCPSLT